MIIGRIIIRTNEPEILQASRHPYVERSQAPRRGKIAYPKA